MGKVILAKKYLSLYVTCALSPEGFKRINQEKVSKGKHSTRKVQKMPKTKVSVTCLSTRKKANVARA